MSIGPLGAAIQRLAVQNRKDGHGFYYEEFIPGTDRWSPRWCAERPALDGDRIKRTSGPGPRIRCLQPLRAPRAELDTLQSYYGPEAVSPVGLRRNRSDGTVEADIERLEE
ncbi:hypothetical protein HKCCE4037_06610 [Rhodobacterales bacterium HKCCE4037]|nr:hypothetical protein [Rhodobacterales bacterium HKCCE4037]